MRVKFRTVYMRVKFRTVYMRVKFRTVYMRVKFRIVTKKKCVCGRQFAQCEGLSVVGSIVNMMAILEYRRIPLYPGSMGPSGVRIFFFKCP